MLRRAPAQIGWANLASDLSLTPPPPALAQADELPMDLAAGTTETLSGIIRDTIDLGTGSLLAAPAGGSLSIFGDIDGPAEGAAVLAVPSGATLYAAGAIDSSVEVDFSGADGTLELAALYLPEMAAGIAGFAPGEVIDVISGTVDTVTVAATGSGEVLTLLDEGNVVGALTLADATAVGSAIFAVPDPIDGTRLLLGGAMAPTAGPAPKGSADGEQFVWGGGTGGSWGDAADWFSPGGAGMGIAPGASDSVVVAGSTSSVTSLAGNGAAATLTTQGLVALGGTFSVDTLVAGAGWLDALVLTADSAILANSVTLQSGVLQIAAAGATVEVAGPLTAQAGLLWVADGGHLTAQSLVLTGGTLRLGAAGMVGVGAQAALAGTLVIAAGGSVSGFGTVRAPVANNGTVQASGGVLAVYGALSGTGVVQIAAGSSLYAPDGVASGQQVAFDGGGTLELFASAAACAAVITGFGVGDVVDIASGTVTQATWSAAGASGGTLDLGSAGTLEISLAAGLNIDQPTFATAPDGLGGTQITLVPCFCRGTALATPGGEAAVETIRPGARVLTRSGAARRVRWVGWRTFDPARLAAEAHLRPVRIRAEALGPGQPRRDLRLSPQHALALATPDGLRLVPAVQLVDGERIVRDPAGAGAEYLHIELDSHDLLLAEGIPVESYLPSGTEQRRLFQSVQGCSARDTRPCLPRLEDGEALRALRARLGLPLDPPGLEDGTPRVQIDRIWRAPDGLHVEGWATRPSNRGATAVMVASGRGAHRRIPANRWRPDLDRAAPGRGCCAFEVVLPAEPR